MTIDLYSAILCPFAHRTRLTMAEKGLQPRLIEIDPRNKPQWFNALSPLGKVPLLKVGEHCLWETSVIDEYLEETFPEPALLPRAPLPRARARAWIRFADTRLYENTRTLLYARTDETQRAAREAVLADLQFMESEGFSRAAAGPYWLGADFTLVDVTFLPWFEQIPVLEKYRAFTWPAQCGALRRWYAQVALRPTVRAQGKPADFYLRAYGALMAA